MRTIQGNHNVVYSYRLSFTAVSENHRSLTFKSANTVKKNFFKRLPVIFFFFLFAKPRNHNV